MPSTVTIISSYVFISISIPFLINSSNLGALLPALAKYFEIDYYFYQTEPIALCLSLVTFYIYVCLGFLMDVTQDQHRTQGFYRKLENSTREVQKLFPPFFISSFLLYMNTTRFDSFRNSFIMFQTLLLILLPIAHLHSAFWGSTCKLFYRSVLMWSLVYALLPRETHYYLSELTDLFYAMLGLDVYQYNSRYNKYYSSSHFINDIGYKKQSYGQQWAFY